VTSVVCALHHHCGCGVSAIKVTTARDFPEWLPTPGEQTDVCSPQASRLVTSSMYGAPRDCPWGNVPALRCSARHARRVYPSCAPSVFPRWLAGPHKPSTRTLWVRRLAHSGCTPLVCSKRLARCRPLAWHGYPRHRRCGLRPPARSGRCAHCRVGPVPAAGHRPVWQVYGEWGEGRGRCGGRAPVAGRRCCRSARPRMRTSWRHSLSAYESYPPMWGIGCRV